MALDQSALLGLLGELRLTDVSDRIRVATETLYQELIDADAAAFIGAAPFERNPDRVTQRNGTRPRTLAMTAGELELRIPKLRTGSFFLSLLERRMLTRSHPKIAAMLEDARDDLLAFTGFPVAHWRQIWSTNPLERLNREIPVLRLRCLPAISAAA